MRRGLVLGAGGVVGYAWTVCALRRLETETGWDPRKADLLMGTSAGSILATALAAGVSTSDLLESLRKSVHRGVAPDARDHLPPTPRWRPLSLPMVRAGLRREIPIHAAMVGLLPEGRGDSSALARSIDRLVPEGRWVEHPNCLVVAVDCESGKRVAFGRDEHTSSREAVRASCAVPGWYAPIAIGGRRYMDGGAVSATSLDLVAHEALDEVYVISPMTSTRYVRASSIGEFFERGLRHVMSAALEREVRPCERAGKRVLRIEPTAPELALMGANFMDPRRRASMLDAWFPA
ncbi:patatin-like phospholipase family protein [Pendulispora rubella]|uniref:Patatin-like phospholipase family protein n=1 Tax=Pendulispora rubella TaxID=2741070 RepID=A0ABZ2LAD1_9BACT